MKQLVETYRGIVKGTSSGWMVSLLFHIGIGVLAVSVYLVIPEQRETIVFKPGIVRPPPKMDLAIPRVNIRKPSNPVRQITRIAVPRNSVEQPQVVVPDLDVNLGMSIEVVSMDYAGLDKGPTLVGDAFGTGFDLVGTFYDFKRDRKGRSVIMDPHKFVSEVAGFVRNGWRTSKFARYYRSPKQLYASSFMVPPVKSSVAPAAFDEADTVGYCWLAHYKGQLAYHEDITFRFWGHGDDVMAVRVGGKEVLVACWPGSTWSPQEALTSAAGGWQSSSSKSRTYALGNNTAVVGDWITLKEGMPLEMEVIIGEVPGGTFCSMLTVEVQGVEYELNRQQAPILPIFKTTEPSRDMKDRILEWLTYDHAAITGGPVFRDIPPAGQDPIEMKIVEAIPERMCPERHIWSHSNGEAFEAEFIGMIGDQVVFKTSRGRQVRIPFAQLSANDQKYVGLSRSPEFNITFTKQSSQRIIEATPFLNEVPPKLLDYIFGAKFKQTSARAYPHTVHAELFVIGQQRIDDRKYILLDHQASTFVPGKDNARSHIFKGEPIELMSYDTSQPRGRKYSDYLLILTDERGELIQQSSSASWLYPNRENLRQLKEGNFLDKTCRRVYPTGPGPKSLYY